MLQIILLVTTSIFIDEKPILKALSTLKSTITQFIINLKAYFPMLTVYSLSKLRLRMNRFWMSKEGLTDTENLNKHKVKVQLDAYRQSRE